MSLADRLKERISAAGTNQSRLADAVGVSPQTISKLTSGESRTSVHLHSIARQLGTSVEYLTGETDDEGESYTPPSIADDHVEIDSIDLAYGMGGTFLDTEAIEIEKKVFPLSWIREFTESDPHFLTIARGIGDSMMPTIHDRDIVLIDRSQTDPTVALGDRIWAVSFGGIGMIKRVRPMPDGTIKLSSDNQLVRDEIATDGDLFVIGRVVGKSSRL